MVSVLTLSVVSRGSSPGPVTGGYKVGICD